MKKLLLICGSARKQCSGLTFFEEIKSNIPEGKFEVTVIHMLDFYHQTKGIDELVGMIKDSDLVGICITDYVNTISYPILTVFEALMEEKVDFNGIHLFGIAHGGMPYLDVHEHCLRVLENFALRKKMNYLGGLILGLTPLINGKPLTEAGFPGKKAQKGLKALTAEVTNFQKVSKATQKKATIPFPSFVAPLFAKILNKLMKEEFAKKGIDLEKDLDPRPYLMATKNE